MELGAHTRLPCLDPERARPWAGFLRLGTDTQKRHLRRLAISLRFLLSPGRHPASDSLARKARLWRQVSLPFAERSWQILSVVGRAGHSSAQRRPTLAPNETVRPMKNTAYKPPRRLAPSWRSSLCSTLSASALGAFALSACSSNPSANPHADPSATPTTNAAQTASALSVTSGLVAHYTFEQADARDDSGNGHDGNSIGTPSFPNERGGRAVFLDGNAEAISIPSAPELTPTSALTACAWVKPDVLTWPTRILQLGSSGYQLYFTDARVIFVLPGVSAEARGTSSGYLRVHEWNHVCGTSDGVTASIYINGQLDSSFAAPSSLRVVNEPLVLGSTHNANAIDYVRGYLDDVAIYSRALSSSEVATIYQEGALQTPVQLTVSCTIPGNLYLNGHATGQTCPTTLSLPVAGHYWVGLGSEGHGYQQHEVIADGTTPLAVSFDDSGWLPRKDWKILIYSVRDVSYDNGKFGHLTDESIAAALASAEQTNEWVIPYSYGLVGWDVDSFIEENYVGEVLIDQNNFPFLDPNGTLQAAGHDHFKSEYDHIFVYYPAARATDGTPYGACCGASTGGPITQIPDTWGEYGNWTENNNGNTEIWFHEWLHGAEWQLGARMGWPLGESGIHGGDIHGFPKDPNLGWRPFYHAFMRGLVPEDGSYVGLSPIGWIESTPLQRTLLIPNLEPTATCSDSLQNGDETDVDCGGSCTTQCALNQQCNVAADCASGTCTAGICSAPSSSDVTASISLSSSWENGYCANVTVQNTGSSAISTWEVSLDLNDSAKDSQWSGVFTAQAGLYIVTPEGWNSSIDANGQRQFGFCATHTGPNWMPAVIAASGS